MLYNPKWLPETKPDVLSLESLIAWLETKNPSTEYEWAKCDGTCLLDQYGDAMGLTRETGRYGLLDAAFDGAPHDRFIAIQSPHTYGGALSRARAALRSVPTRNGTEA